MILEKLFIIISDLCGLSVFAGDIPSFGCAYDYKPDKVPTA